MGKKNKKHKKHIHKNGASHDALLPVVQHDAGLASHITKDDTAGSRVDSQRGFVEASRAKLLLVLLLGFIIGFGLAWLILADKEYDTSSDEVNETAEGIEQVDGDIPPPPPGEENIPDALFDPGQAPASVLNAFSRDAVLVDDQKAGMQVTLSEVGMTRLGWVAIGKFDEDIALQVLGAKRFDVGSYKNVTMNLLAPTQVGTTYRAVLYYDDGDGVFDHKKDTLILRSEDTPQGTVFTVFN